MKRDVYKSALDKLKFDEQLDNKIMEYLNENNTQGENEMKNFNKRKKRVSVATAASAVIMISGVTYAAVMNFKNVSHNEYGLSVSNNQSESTSIKGDSKFNDSADQRERMEKEDTGYKLISEEIGTENDKWSKRTVWEDTTPTYISEDAKNWDVDESEPTSQKVKYAYGNYADAAKDANMPNVMSKLLSQVKSNSETYYEEYLTEGNEKITGKQISGGFEYKSGKVYTELLKNLDKDENVGVSVITGVNKATNEREYKSKAGVTYKLSDNTNDNKTKTTTLVSTGEYTLIVQFENITDEEIHTILENLDLVQLEK